MDWTEIAGALAAAAAVIGPIIWKVWAVAKRIGDRLWERFFGEHGYVTKSVAAHLAFVEATGMKLEENDKDLDTIDKRTIEILEHTKRTAEQTAATDANLRVLLEATRKYAENHGHDEIARKLEPIIHHDNGTK